MNYVLGIDLGTSSIKGLVMSSNYEIIHIESVKYDVMVRKSGYSEQDPLKWLEAFEQLITNISHKVIDFNDKLLKICFSGQMHSLVLLDRLDQILYPAILWNDVRNFKQCEYLNNEHKKEILEITKNIVLEGFTLPKILWIKENKKDIFSKIAKITLPKDYLTYYLTGNYTIDISNASGTLLLDLNNKQWSKKILDLLEISVDQLPKLVESDEVVGVIKESLRQKYNFKNTVEIISGGADNAMAALGSGVIKNNILLSIGTSGVVLKPISQDEINTDLEKCHLFNHALKDAFYKMGVTLCAAESLKWLVNTLYQNTSFEEIFKEIESIDDKSENLLFTPYLLGERTPYKDPFIRGSFIGLSRNHQAKHLSKAVLEGITFSLKQVYDDLIKSEHQEKIISVGGGAKNKLWLQMQADIFNRPIYKLNIDEGAALGGVLLCLKSLSPNISLEELIAQILKYEVFYPNAKKVIKYQKLYKLYQKVYQQTCDLTHEILKVGE